MKTQTPTTILYMVLFFLISCDDQFTSKRMKDEYNRWSDSGAITPLLNGADAGPIDALIAKSWVNNFKTRSGRIGTTEHYFHRSGLEQIMSQEGCTGVRIYYATSPTGDLSLIIVAVNNEGKNILTSGPLLIVSNQTLEDQAHFIGYDAAQANVTSYSIRAGETAIKSHYFGRNGVDELLSQSDCVGINVYQAVNEAGYDKLLIAAVTRTDGAVLQDAISSENSLPTGRSNDIDPPSIVLDFSFPCPSTCPNGHGKTL